MQMHHMWPFAILQNQYLCTILLLRSQTYTTNTRVKSIVSSRNRKKQLLTYVIRRNRDNNSLLNVCVSQCDLRLKNMTDLRLKNISWEKEIVWTQKPLRFSALSLSLSLSFCVTLVISDDEQMYYDNWTVIHITCYHIKFPQFVWFKCNNKSN